MKGAVSRARDAERVVTPLELFFDLVYVFAIGQLSHHLVEHVDLRTGAQTVILALAVLYALFLITQTLFLRDMLGHLPRSRLLGLAALLVLAIATAPLTLMAGIAASGAVLVAVAIADTVGE